MIDKLGFRNAMANLAAAVNIVTCRGAEGPAGCTVSAACSVTDEPPTLLVCISRASRSNAVFRESGALCVNVLSAAQQHIAQRFADSSVSVQERFALARWDTLTTGSPVLREALASFDCEITGAAELGTHTVFTCAVKAVQTHGSGDSLVYFARGYHRLTVTSSALA
ncbi:MAG: flavin reductase [Ramlibacter sp.]